MEMTPFSEQIWQSKYRYQQESAGRERDIADTWQRVAAAAASVENRQDEWRQAFYRILAEYRFLPGGRILAGAGTDKRVTLFNCFVMGPVVDSIDGIFESLKETALTMQQGGGIGCDFSTLRPAGSAAISSGSIASGPVPFLRIWDALCETLLATSARRGAMMATLRCDHPDIQSFIDAKRNPCELNNFNLSVLISDDFMKAVADDVAWELRFPPPHHGDTLVYRRLPARELWRQLVDAARDTAEPGVLFIDGINRDNNLYYRETISATNPCGEIPLPPYGACNLGSLNLTAFVQAPFESHAGFDERRLAQTAETAVRFLDNVIDISHFPLEQQVEQARGTRRIGLGVTGLADTLVMLGLHYDSDAGRDFAARAMQVIRDAAYSSSIELAREKGAFPFLNRQKHLAAPFIRRLPEALQSGIVAYGIRNSHLLAVAPTGTISLLADNVSSGIEPIYAFEAERAVRDNDFHVHQIAARDRAYDLWLTSGKSGRNLPQCFVTAEELPPRAHLEMQASVQRYVDNAISKTVNLPKTATSDEVADVYLKAHALNLKGCTVFRSGAARGQVLRARDESHCCDIDREAD